MTRRIDGACRAAGGPGHAGFLVYFSNSIVTCWLFISGCSDCVL